MIVMAIFLKQSFSKMKWKDENEARGVLLLDGFTFNKVVPHEKYAVLVGFFKKSDIGRNSKADSLRDDFLEFAVDGNKIGDLDEIICAQVIINGAENKAIADRYGVSNLPQIILFQKNETSPIFFDDRKAGAETISDFVSEFTGFYVRMEGHIEVYDKLIYKFLKPDITATERESLIAEAEAALPAILNFEKPLAEYYLKVMKKVHETGFDYVLTEYKRVEGIVEAGKVSKEKIAELTKKFNILLHFRQFQMKQLHFANIAAMKSNAADASTTGKDL